MNYSVKELYISMLSKKSGFVRAEVIPNEWCRQAGTVRVRLSFCDGWEDCTIVLSD